MSIFENPIFETHFQTFIFASPHGPPYFLTFNGTKYHPSIEWNDEEGILQDLSTHAPHSSKKDFKVSSFFFFLVVGKFVDFMFCWELYGGHCHFVVVCFCGKFLDILRIGLKSLCGHFFWAFFNCCLILSSLDNIGDWWSFALYEALGIVRWILTWFFE